MKLIITTIFFLCSQPLFASMVGDGTFVPKVPRPAFTKVHPRVLFDQGHGNLDSADGRYAPILSLLKQDGYLVTTSQETFDANSLKAVAILYVSAAMPNPKNSKANPSAFTEDEIQSIKEWVRGGGSLLLMTDHSIMADAAEPLVNAFGVTGSGGTTHDDQNTIPELKDPGIIVFSPQQMNSKSAIVSGRASGERIARVVAFDGQSLVGPSGSDAVLTFKDSAMNHLADQKTSPAKGRAEVVALKFGKGCVVVSGDATMFTSKIDPVTGERYGINRPGTDNVQFALNIFHWVSGLLDQKSSN